MTTQHDELAGLIERLTASADWLEHGAKTADVPLASGPDLRKAAALLAADAQAGGEVVAYMWQHDETGRIGFVEAEQINNGWQELNPRCKVIRPLYTHPQPQAVAQRWRDWVEQRLLNWRQQKVNRSGDQLALDDFMDKQSLDDLIDYVCSEYEGPDPMPSASPAAPAAAQVAQPLTDQQREQIAAKWRGRNWTLGDIIDAVEAAHGIGKDQAP